MLISTFLDQSLSFYNVDLKAVLDRDIPVLFGQYGIASTIVDGVPCVLRATDPVVHYPDMSVDDLIHGAESLKCTIRGKLALTKGDEVLCEVLDTVLVEIPICTGVATLPGTPLLPGVFLINGKNRSIPYTKTPPCNTALYATRSDGSHRVQIRSKNPHKPFRSTSTLYLSLDSTYEVTVVLPFQDSSVNLSVVVSALGGCPSTFFEAVRSGPGGAHPTVFRAYEIAFRQHPAMSQTEALTAISKSFGKAGVAAGRSVLTNELLPHVGTSDEVKLRHMELYVAQLILYKSGKWSTSTRDSAKMTHLVSSADFIGQLFRLQLIAHMRTAGKLVRRAVQSLSARSDEVGRIDLAKLYGESRLSARIQSSVASGAWSMQKKGVSMSLNVNNQDAMLGQMRRVSSSLTTTDGLHMASRSVSPDQYGYLCAANSPDGSSIGLVSELAILASVTTRCVLDPTVLVVALSPWLCEQRGSVAVVGPNGVLLGYSRAEHVPAIVEALRRGRRSGQWPRYLSVERTCEGLRVWCEPGMLCRALWVYGAPNPIHLQFEEALAAGHVELITPHEEQTLCRVALSPDGACDGATHVELCEVSFVGQMASKVPFMTSQQGPRLSYLTNQRKQFITAEDKPWLGGTCSTQLYHAHKSMVKTAVDQNPDGIGTPCVVAWLAMPDNQEDAILVNRASVERGLMQASLTRVYQSDTVKGAAVSNERFEAPVAELFSRKHATVVCGPDGMPPLRAKITGGDILIGKTRAVKSSAVRRDISVLARKDETGVVTGVDRIAMSSGERVYVTVRSSLPVQVGDKLSTNFSQKGVVSQLVAPEDMPFSVNGIIPDIVVSPLGQTSRMTMGQLLEALLGKAVVLDGDLSIGVDQQEFSRGNGEYVKRAERILAQHGFSSRGTEQFTCGTTGQPMAGKVFTGVCNYFRLVHLASKKLHSRQTGPRDPLTRQPRDGRRAGGGLRLGELEACAIVSHGGSYTLNERFNQLSDGFEILICAVCGLMAEGSIADDLAYCRACLTTGTCMAVSIPFSSLLLFYELMATGILLRFTLEKSEV